MREITYKRIGAGIATASCLLVISIVVIAVVTMLPEWVDNSIVQQEQIARNATQ